jgi:5'(3')-deoxyribonucleotidase
MKTNQRITVALDVDDVLAAFYPEMCRRFNKPELKTNIWDGKESCKWVADEFPQMWEDCSFWANMNVLSYPQSITFEVTCYITAIDPKLCGVRKDWLIRNGFPDRPVFCTIDRSKLEIMEEQNIDMLIDDKPSTIQAVRKAGRYGIQFIPHYMSNYNDSDPFSIRHLSEVSQIIEEIERDSKSRWNLYKSLGLDKKLRM